MATAAAAAPQNQIQIQHHHKLQQRRKCKVTTIISSTITDFRSQARNLDPPNVVSPDHNSSWCCPASKTAPTPSSPPAHQPGPDRPLPPSRLQRAKSCNSNTPLPTKKPDPDRILLPLPPQRSYKGSTFSINNISSSSPTQESNPARHSPTTNHGHHLQMDYSSPGSNTNSGFTKFNSALTAGLLNPMSPPLPLPQPPPIPRSNPTLFEMMSNEPDVHPKTTTLQHQTPSINNSSNNITFTIQNPKQPALTVDKQTLTLHRISGILSMPSSPGNQFNDFSSSDIRLTLSSKDGITTAVNLHRPILVANSRFFATKLSQMSRSQCMEISDCDDVEGYIEALRLMYCKDLRKMLMKEDVPRVLGILKVSAAIGFDAGVLSCLEYLEAAPWAEDEEEKVASLISELRLESVAAGEVLKRVSVENQEAYSENEEVLVKLLHVVLEGKDEKARREMKGLVTKMLRENSSHSDLRKDSLYAACAGCFELLRHHFIKAAASDLDGVNQIGRQADNLDWMLHILIDRQIAEDFLKMWASQSELSKLHSQVPAVHRHEISRVTARLFVGIGKGQLLASKDARYLLLQTWLVPFYDDFKWMKRASGGLDKNLIEDGLSSTILTLPLPWQQEILLAWFHRFLNASEDCPNIQRGFEIWWRRAFGRRNDVPEGPHQFRATKAMINSS